MGMVGSLDPEKLCVRQRSANESKDNAESSRSWGLTKNLIWRSIPSHLESIFFRLFFDCCCCRFVFSSTSSFIDSQIQGGSVEDCETRTCSPIKRPGRSEGWASFCQEGRTLEFQDGNQGSTDLRLERSTCSRAHTRARVSQRVLERSLDR